MRIEEEFLKNLRDKTSLKAGDKVIVAVSGGMDSVVLLSLFLKYKEELGLDLIVVHVNHLLRGQDSEDDQDFVVDLAEKNDLKCFVLRENVRAVAKKNSWSIEEAGRIVRYNYLNNIFSEEKADKIAVAHHLKDQGETILFHIIRGSGIKGLRGMFFEKGNIIRPLLNVDKDEIEGYSVLESLDFREDESNFNDTYTRNRIRMSLIPSLKEYNPRIEEQLYKLGDIVKVEDDFMEEVVSELYDKVVEIRGNTSVLSDDIRGVHKGIKRRLFLKAYESLVGKHLEYRYVLDMENYLESAMDRKLPLPNDVTFYYDGKFFILNKFVKVDSYPKDYVVVSDLDEYSFLDSTLSFSRVFEVSDFIIKDSPIAYLDLDKLKFPLVIRNLRDDDVFRVVRGDRDRGLKKLLASRGFNKMARESVPLVVDSSGRIAFIPFIGVSEYFILESSSENILMIEYKKD